MMRAFVIILALLVCQGLAKTTGLDEKVEGEEKVDNGDADSQERVHPCFEKHCDRGYECDLDEHGAADCVCIRECPYVEDDVPICTTSNQTFASECSFYREQCLCRHQKPGCENPDHMTELMDYYGKCQELLPCKEDELVEFPHRMREWLFLVMEELGERGDLSAGAQELLRETRSLSRHWVIPAIWKFCELDVTADRFVTQEELLPVSAPLKPLERCSAPFLEKCDEDNNGQIDLIEWGSCLELDQDEITDRCDALKN